MEFSWWKISTNNLTFPHLNSSVQIYRGFVSSFTL